MIRPGKAIGQVFSSIFKKPATISYPKIHIKMPKNFRGKISFKPSLCIGCKMCVRDCPSGAIQITKIAERQFQAEIDLAKCIYCAQCVDSCMKKALSFTDDFELAAIEKSKLKMVLNEEPKDKPQEKAG